MKRLFASVALIVIASGALSAQDVGGIYAKNCANCHGGDGRGNTALGRALKLRDLRSPEVKKFLDDELVAIISKGADHGRMPGFEKKLGADTIHELATYVRQIDVQPASAPQRSKTAKAQADPEPTDAKSIYSAKCSHCHGSNGSGSTALGRTLKLRDIRSPEAQRLSDSELIAIIAHGSDRGRMPGFQKKLGSEMVEQLASYVRELAARPPVRATTETMRKDVPALPASSGSVVQVETAISPMVQPEEPAAQSDPDKPTVQSSNTSRWASLRSAIIPGSRVGRRAEVVDLNSASKKTLMTLPGITEADAVSIIAGRPYKSSLQFKIRRIVSPEVYERIADRVIAKQSGRATQRAAAKNAAQEAAGSGSHQTMPVAVKY